MSSCEGAATYSDVVSPCGTNGTGADIVARAESKSHLRLITIRDGKWEVSGPNEEVQEVSATETRSIRWSIPLVVSSFILCYGLFDIVTFQRFGESILNPYFDFLVAVGGGFLVATTAIAMRGK
jgi:hypothetical protein